MKKITLVSLCALIFLSVGLVEAQEEGVTIGGDIKFYLYDQSSGEVDGESQSNNGSAGFNSIILYISKEITDEISVNVDPEIRVSAGATPRLGGEITRVTDAEIEVEILRANLTWLMPNSFQLKMGYLKPLFTWDYGYELFWNEEFHASPVTANSWLGSWHDSGIELYKSFEPEGCSVPVYLYLLNGGGAEVDNNNGKTVLLHVAPEFMNGMLKLLGSYGRGKWDDDDKYDMERYAFGINLNIKDLTLRGEYMAGTWENQYLVAEGVRRDISPSGSYIKALYNFLPNLRGLVGYSHLNHDFSGFFYTGSGVGETYDTVTLGLNYFLADGVTAMLQYSMVDADRDDGSAALEYDRVTLGMRVTF